MDIVKGLKCRECGERYEGSMLYMCDGCFSPLEVEFDLESFTAAIKGGCDVSQLLTQLAMLPSSFDSGNTPLIKADRIGRRLGTGRLYLKDEGASSASHSFKDRVVASALAKAREFGIDTVAAASTGNLANALAAHASKAGMKSILFVPRETDYSRIGQALESGAEIFEVQGNYDAANRLCSEAEDAFGWAVINGNLKPYYLEGAKSLLFEVIMEMEGAPPASIVAPMGGGGLMTMLWKGIGEMKAAGLIKGGVPGLYGAQASGCSPIIAALKCGSDFIRPVKPETAVGAIAIGDPPDGSYAMQSIRESGGTGETATDEEAFEMVRLLEREEGIATGAAGGVALAVAEKLLKRGSIASDSPVVVILTDRGGATGPSEGVVKRVAEVAANLSAFREIWKARSS